MEEEYIKHDGIRMNCFYTRKVGFQDIFEQQPPDGEIHQWITEALYVVYSLFHATADTARDLNPKYFLGVLSRACTSLCAGDAQCLARNANPLYSPRAATSCTHPLQSTTMAGPRERCLRVFAHKSRLVSLKSVVRDIGRAYIKNRPYDERSARIVQLSRIPCLFDYYYRCYH